MSRLNRRISILGAALTFNGLRPFPSSNPLSIPSFFAGWLTIELAPHNLAITTGHLGALLRKRRSWDRDDRIAAALDVASIAGLSFMIKQALDAREVITEALASSVGPDAATTDPAPTKPDLATPWRQVMMPWRMKDPRVVRHADIDYVGDGNVRHLLDIYTPREPASTPRPVIFQIHGGGWVIGKKDQQGLPLMSHLSARGWVCVAINYPLSPKAKWPEHLIACKQALVWVKEHIHEYGGDPNWIAATGGSAGGHLASLVGLTPNIERFQPGFESADTTVQACVPFYGVYDMSNELDTKAGKQRLDMFLAKTVFGTTDPEPARDATPLRYVTAEAPPMFVIHGTHDSLADVAEARELVRRLRLVSRNRVAYAELPGTQHAFEVFPSIRSAHVIRGVERFLVGVRGSAPN